jgi:hypothetical protein
MMSKTSKIILGGLAVFLLCIAVFSLGLVAGRVMSWMPGYSFDRSPTGSQLIPGWDAANPYPPGSTPGMMNRFSQIFRRGWLPFRWMGPGLMDPGRMGPGMMGGAWGARTPAAPLSLDEAEKAVEVYLSGLDDSDLALKEIMVFDNHAYAEIYEQSTGVGAMEVLVDPISKAVYPEYGPNMMWNLKYGMMSPSGMGHGMMGGWNRRGNRPQDVSAEMPISPDEALVIAQQYLDGNFSGLQVGEEADPFYGYYTVHTLKNGATSGMLSVNGFSGEVYPHTWHGEFIEMSEEHEE